MAFSVSVDRIDETGRELLSYGTEDFPIAFFDDDLTIVSVPYHWHDEFEIVIITEGSIRVRIAGEEFTLSAGDGYFTNKGILHASTLKTSTGHQHALVFSPGVVSQSGDLIWKTYVSPILENRRFPFLRLSASVSWQREILQLAEAAWRSGGYETEDYPIVVRSSLSRAFSLLMRHINDPENAFRYSGRLQRDEERIKKALVFIEKNFDGSVTIENIAESASVSTSTCLRLFGNVLGTTPIAFLVEYRLRRAVEELKHADGRTISEIAYSCGFSDASYFNRCFRKEYGITPTEYISKHLANK
ncbi:MAG: helix-turn-helix transcriptional regulator [Oscillospiraceae bacterium]|nr:helix-turn-helix transcriptional regulator [Oscillospiraceae bacterium]